MIENKTMKTDKYDLILKKINSQIEREMFVRKGYRKTIDEYESTKNKLLDRSLPLSQYDSVKIDKNPPQK